MCDARAIASCIHSDPRGATQAILQRLKEFGVGVFDSMTFDDFNTCYFAIFDDLDKGTFDAKSTVLTSISTSDIDAAKRDEKCVIS